jgi:circadian clock protein KaiC
MNRTKTGIRGLDKALTGGIHEGNIVLLSGGAGTGKSTFCLQFLVNGAKMFGEKGLYISTEQSEFELQRQGEGFRWDLMELQKKGMFKLIYFDITQGDDILAKALEAIKTFKPKRIAIDSMTTMTDALIIGGLSQRGSFNLVQVAENVSPIPRTEQIVSKSILYKLVAELKRYNTTTLLTSELPEDARALSSDGVSEFITDGVIILRYFEIGIADYRSMFVRKMRYSAYEKDILPYNITEEGITITEGDKFKA